MHGEIVTSQRNLHGPLFMRQSNNSHAYPSRPFIAMSHFLALDETFESRPALTLTRSRMELAGGTGGGGGGPQGPGEQPGILRLLIHDRPICQPQKVVGSVLWSQPLHPLSPTLHRRGLRGEIPYKRAMMRTMVHILATASAEVSAWIP
jgi:hypothetical protein